MASNFPDSLESRWWPVSSSGAATAVDLSYSDNIYVALTENTTISRPTHPRDGIVYRFLFLNTASNYTVAWASNCFNFVGASAPTVTVGVKYSLVYFIYHKASDRFFEMGRYLNMG